MPKVSTKRQITLPVNQCDELGIQPGDEVESFVANGHLTIIKKVQGAASGVLKHIKSSSAVSDEDSLKSALTK